MKKRDIRFPGLYTAFVRMTGLDFAPDHFFDLLVLSLVGAAFMASCLATGGISQNDSVMAPRLLASAGALHAYSLVTRAGRGVRLRWVGALLLPFALWLLADSRFHSVAAWRGREQGMVALCAAAAFWVTLHHLRHKAHKWMVLGGMGALASATGLFALKGEHSMVARLANRSVSTVYEGQATGPFATPAEFGALLLLCLFPMAAVMISPATRQRRRLVSTYVVGLCAIGLWMSQHAPSWYGLLAGAGVMSVLLLPSGRKAAVTLAALAGAAFFVPKVVSLHSGLFRAVESTAMSPGEHAPLAAAALNVFKAHPLAGAGSGGFPMAFEAVRPWGWYYDPLTAGGFFHQLLAENGLAGSLLLLLPAVVLWVGAFALCRRIPNRVVKLDKDSGATQVHVPETRMALAGILSGALAAAVALGLDYPRPSVSLTLVFAVYAAIAAREVFGRRLSTTLKPDPKPRVWLRSVVVAAPVLAFGLAVFPVFESADRARRAEELAGIVDETAPQGKNADVKKALFKQALQVAQREATEALRAVPDNARAAAALSESIAGMYRVTGRPASLGDCLSLAEFAAKKSGYEPTLSLPLVAALRMHGKSEKAGEALALLRKHAPRNIPLALEEARNQIENGRADLAAPTIGEILRAQPLNPEANRLQTLVKMAR